MAADSIAPAPWHLTGSGYILLYKFPRQFGIAHSPFGMYQRGFGSVMLVNYATSPVDAYHELLFIPGQVSYPGATGYSISTIYVSSRASVVGGQTNWGIPKALAEFEWQTAEAGGDRITVRREDEQFFEAELTPYGFSFPINAFLLPPVVQHRDGKTFITKLKSAGRGQLARVDQLKVTGDAFPGIDRFKPLVALKITAFEMTFPVPQIIPDQA